MIIRIIAVDPSPRDRARDLVVYQVPERSREFELLVWLFEREGIEYTVLESTTKKGRKRAPADGS